MAARRLMLALVLCLLALAACASGTPTPTAPPSAATRTTITFWHAWPDQAGDMLEQLALHYQRQTPGVEIKVVERSAAFLKDDYRGAVLSGTAPDLVLLSYNRWLGELAKEQIVISMTNLIDEELKQQLPSFARDAAIYEGNYYGLPLSYNLPVLFYNQANVLEAPQDSESWLQLAGLAPEPEWGLAYNLTLDFTLPYLSAFGGKIIENGQLVLNKGGPEGGLEGTLAWLEWLRALRAQARAPESRLLANEDHTAINSAVQSRRARMMVVGWASALPIYRALWGNQLGVAALPQLASPGAGDGQTVPYVQSEVLAISIRSGQAEKSAALGFMRWLAGLEAQRMLLELQTRQPVNLRVDFSGYPLSETIARIAANGIAAPTMPEMELVWAAIRDMVRKVLLNENFRVKDAVDQTAADLCTSLPQLCTS